MKAKRFFVVFSIITFAFSYALAQDPTPQPSETPRVVGEVTVQAKTANSEPIYVGFRKASEDSNAFSGKYATVNNLVLKRDRAIFTLRSGEIYFLKETEGMRTGAVFIGDGNLSLEPPIDIEKRMLKFFTESEKVNEDFTQLVMFFTDETFKEVENSPNAKISTNGSQAGKARDAYRGKESAMKGIGRLRYNMPTRILMDKYGPERRGFFWSYIDGKKYNSLLFKLDPLGVTESSPEQVTLTNYDRNSYGRWLSFHLDEEYKKGTGNSNQDRRVFDIKHHNIEVTLRGLRMIASDEMTLQTRVKGQRVLPFNLYRHMRVKRVLDENGEEVNYIQEDKSKDFGLAVILPKAPEAGKPFKLLFEYDGVESLRNAGTGNYVLVSRTNWYPNNQSSAFLDRATFDLKFRYPKQYMLVGVGELVEEKEDEGNLKYSHWSTKGVEMATAGFNYGDFKMSEFNDKITGYELSVYNNKDLPGPLKNYIAQIENIEARRANRGQSALAINVGGINTSSMAKTVLDEALNSVRLFDYYFGKLPHKRIAMTQQPSVGSGQAWATLVFMPYMSFVSDTHRKEIFGIRSANAGFWREVGPHEVAHQWWGHAVGWTSYRDQWMSEGFAELSASLYVQYVYKDTERFIKYWEDQRDLIVNSTPGTRGYKPYEVGPLTQGVRLFNSKAPGAYRRLVYPKGAFVLHMLRMMMIDPKKQGINKDDRFRAMMKDFIKTHYNQDVSTEDFKRIVEKHATPQMARYQNGRMDWFFNQWVYGTDVPKYEFEYKLDKVKGQTILNAKITQSNVSDNFVMPVPVYVNYGKGWVELGKADLLGNRTYELKNVPLQRKPKKVAILAYQDILATSVKNKKMR